MKIVKIYGGLGNQMFQYAFALSLAAASGDEVLMDSSALRGDSLHNGFELGKVFGVGLPEAEARDVDRLSDRPAGILSRARRKYLTKSSHVIDRKFGYQPELLSRLGDAYFEGYWQSEKYFAARAREIRQAYSFSRPLAQRNIDLLKGLPRPVASVHVRRGDYLKYGNLNICTSSYYHRAIESMIAGSGVASLLFLSEDPEYCRTAIGTGGARAAFADWNRGEDSWQDMALMSLCDHHIIANSSFSWWGAWLDAKAGARVIAPAIWNGREIRDEDHYYSFTFRDVVPETWGRERL